MKKTILFCLSLLLLALAGCTLKRSSPESSDTPAAPKLENAVSADKKVRADDPADADWAKKRVAAPAETDVLLRKTRYDGEGQLLGWTEYALNDAGRCVVETERRADGSVDDSEYTYIQEYEYVNGWRTAMNQRSADGVLRYRTRYDENGNAVKWIVYNEDGSVKMWSADEFDEYGNITVRTMYRPDSEPEIMNRREYEFDERGNITECRYLGESGNVLNRYRYRYEYDERGHISFSEEVDVGASLLVSRMRYEYDEQGRLAVSYQLDGDDRCMIRTETDYDEQGRVARERLYNSAGELSVTVEYTRQ